MEEEALLRTTAEESAFEAREEARRLGEELRVWSNENERLSVYAGAAEEAERLREQLDKKVQEADCLSSELIVLRAAVNSDDAVTQIARDIKGMKADRITVRDGHANEPRWEGMQCGVGGPERGEPSPEGRVEQSSEGSCGQHSGL